MASEFFPTRSQRTGPRRACLPAFESVKPAEALDNALGGIAARYGTGTADFVAMQLEYPKRNALQ